MRGGWVFWALASLCLLFAAGALAADPTWPAPCADAGTCWVAWDAPTWGGPPTRYEVVSGDLLCGVVQGSVTRKGRAVPPATVYQPRPGDGCWQPDAQLDYAILAVNDAGTSPRSGTVTFGPQTWACYDSRCEVPCAPGLPLRYPNREGCP